MRRNGLTLIQDANLVRQLVHLDNTPGPIRDAVIVTADRHQAVMADATFELEQFVKGHGWKRTAALLAQPQKLRQQRAVSSINSDEVMPAPPYACDPARANSAGSIRFVRFPTTQSQPNGLLIAFALCFRLSDRIKTGMLTWSCLS